MYFLTTFQALWSITSPRFLRRPEVSLERKEMGYSARHTSTKHKKGHTRKSVSSVLALPIFPGRRQPSIVSRNELNYRVRNGNGWTLALISTNYVIRSYRRTSCIILSFPRFVKRLYPTFQTSKAFEK